MMPSLTPGSVMLPEKIKGEAQKKHTRKDIMPESNFSKQMNQFKEATSTSTILEE
jgi:hypothetical protein